MFVIKIIDMQFMPGKTLTGYFAGFTRDGEARFTTSADNKYRKTYVRQKSAEKQLAKILSVIDDKSALLIEAVDP